MKSQVTRVTAATLLSIEEGDCVLANLIASGAQPLRQYRSTLPEAQIRGELFQLLCADTTTNDQDGNR